MPPAKTWINHMTSEDMIEVRNIIETLNLIQNEAGKYNRKGYAGVYDIYKADDGKIKASYSGDSRLPPRIYEGIINGREIWLDQIRPPA